MEKYRSTADHATGVHPFIPPYIQERRHTVLEYLAGVVLMTIRLPLVIAIFVFVLFCDGCVTVLNVSSMRTIRDSFGCRLLLILFGADHAISGLKKLMSSSPPGLIVANHGSFLDVVLLAAAVSPTFTRCAPSSTGYLVEERSLLGAILDSFSSGVQRITDQSRASRLVDMVRIHSGPKSRFVVVFPEATTSNGRGILRFSDVFQGRFTCAVHLVGFMYPKPDSSTSKWFGHSPAFTIGHPLGHIGRLLTNWKCPWNVRAFAPHVAGGVATTIIPEDFRKVIGQLCGVPVLSVGPEQRKLFEKHWAETSKGQAYRR